MAWYSGKYFGRSSARPGFESRAAQKEFSLERCRIAAHSAGAREFSLQRCRIAAHGAWSAVQDRGSRVRERGAVAAHGCGVQAGVFTRAQRRIKAVPARTGDRTGQSNILK